ncbi:heterokaryon incompatibility protein-domain-containing protein [Achaetomium macrosporum]|uniref:Heterokaryon incompatibility protein-domain-containing protein n=1 Tax=Achaetomium macrosporum TaxID=79813 RepID=A0AAN7C0A6_9PEZI|nr:heterokaryon incompatibility protein-domain-containing protein [Achaetomium macrosporum]
MIESWLAYCRENHSDICGRPVRYAAKFELPTRLIDVSPTNNAGSLRLVLGRDVPKNSTDRRYVALSHCWGKKPSLIPSTTKANLETRIATIPWGDLPKTFKDAVTILRKLSVRYLWIDSLCIVQDDEDDWARESATMHNVYTCAYFTIAASAAEDSTGGIFAAGDPKRFGACTLMSKWKSISNLVTVYPTFAAWDMHLQGPLSSRGWTFQEYQLSPRVIHFTEGRIMWECTDFGGQASEDRPVLGTDKVRPRLIRRLARQDLTNARFGVLPASPGVKMFKHVRIGKNYAVMREMDDVETEWWHNAIHDYSGRRLTRPSDKLPALAGYAAALHTYIGQWYLAGIWGLNLPQGLLWCPDWEREARIAHSKWPPTSLDPLLPSWTWAAFDGPIRYLSEREYNVNDVQILDFDIEHHNANLFGRVTRGSIKIKTEFAMDVAINESDACEGLQPEMVRLPKSYRMFGERQKFFIRKLLPRSRHFDGVIYFDTDPASLPQTVVTCIRIGEGVGRLMATRDPSSMSTSRDIGLALIRVSENGSAGVDTGSGIDASAEKFRRVGMFEVLSGNSKWKARCVPRVLTLV